MAGIGASSSSGRVPAKVSSPCFADLHQFTTYALASRLRAPRHFYSICWVGEAESPKLARDLGPAVQRCRSADSAIAALTRCTVLLPVRNSRATFSTPLPLASATRIAASFCGLTLARAGRATLSH